MERRDYNPYQEHRQQNYHYKNVPRKRPFSEVEKPKDERPAHLFSASPISPWCSRDEWLDVYRQIAPVLANPTKDALRSLNIERLEHIINTCWAQAWNIKQDAAVLTILISEGLRAIRLSERTVIASKDVAVASMAIIRFVKEVSEPFMRSRGDGGKEVTIAKICGRFGVRAEVVQIRHGSSHSDMHEARKVEEELVFVADWLKTKFWDDEERRINKSDNLLRSKESKPGADALCQQIRTDLLSLRETVQRDAKAKKNWRKANRKQLEAHLSAITDFLTQNFHENLDVFCNVLAEEFLSPSEVSLDKLGSSEEIHALRDSLPPGLPSTCRDEWYFLVEHVLSFPGGANCILNKLARLMGDQNPERDHLTCAWILCVLVEILPTNRKSSTRIWDPVDFLSVAKHIISRPSRFALPVLEKIAKVGVSNQKEFKFMQDLMKLCRAAYPSLSTWSAKSSSSTVNDENQNPVKTVEDVKKEVSISSSSSGNGPFSENLSSAKAHSLTTGLWSVSTDLSWKNLPIGVLPTHNGIKFDLYNSLLLPGNGLPNGTTSRNS